MKQGIVRSAIAPSGVAPEQSVDAIPSFEAQRAIFRNHMQLFMGIQAINLAFLFQSEERDVDPQRGLRTIDRGMRGVVRSLISIDRFYDDDLDPSAITDQLSYRIQHEPALRRREEPLLRRIAFQAMVESGRDKDIAYQAMRAIYGEQGDTTQVKAAVKRLDQSVVLQGIEHYHDFFMRTEQVTPDDLALLPSQVRAEIGAPIKLPQKPHIPVISRPDHAHISTQPLTLPHAVGRTDGWARPLSGATDAIKEASGKVYHWLREMMRAA